jgi:cellulose synthase/poly-beta-1,6-N-acetylglucosamine synthase-like glycosyltransferase
MFWAKGRDRRPVQPLLGGEKWVCQKNFKKINDQALFLPFGLSIWRVLIIGLLFFGLGGLGLLIQLFFYFFGFGRLAWGPNLPRSQRLPPAAWPPVSVVVAARNELDNLQRLLPLLLAQDYPQFEVVVVNDRSWDETWPYLHALAQAQPRLRAVHVSDKPDDFSGKKYALTLGIKAAQFPVLLFTDADCMPQSGQWIAQMASRMGQGHEIVLGFSPYSPRPGLLNLFIQFETLLTATQYFGLATWGRPYMGVGRNLAYRRELFFRHKGFHRHIKVIGGDDDLFVNQAAHKSNVAICLGAESIVTSLPKTTLSDWFWQKKRHLGAGKFYKWGDKFLLGLFSTSHLLVWLGGLGLIGWAVVMGQWQWGAVGLAGLALKWTAQALVLAGCKRKLGDQTPLIWLPLLDFLYAAYYFVVGWAAIVSKKSKWK